MSRVRLHSDSHRNDGGGSHRVGDVTEEKLAMELIEAAIEHFGQIDGAKNVGQP